jgi:hypothetical protein
MKASPPAHSSVTVIAFSVSVPVLSEQITVVLPSASTAGRWRMMARRFAMRPTPMASVMLIAAGRPSGIAPTASATAAISIATQLSPRSTPMAKVSAARPRITHSSRPANSPIFFVSGVAISGAPAIRPEMRPVSVASAVATTRPLPWPATTVVPA